MRKHKWLASQERLFNKSTSVSSGESLVIGLRSTLPPVLTSTTLTSPSCPGYTASIRPIFHSGLVAFGSINKTKSTTLRFSVDRNYLWRDPIVGKYFRIQRFHTLRINSCTRLHRLRTAVADVSTVSGAPIWPIKRWFGVNNSSSLTTPLTVVKGLGLVA